MFVYGRERRNDDVLLREKETERRNLPIHSRKKKKKTFAFSFDLIVFETHSFCYLKRSCLLQNNGHTGKYSKSARVHSEIYISS